MAGWLHDREARELFLDLAAEGTPLAALELRVVIVLDIAAGAERSGPGAGQDCNCEPGRPITFSV